MEAFAQNGRRSTMLAPTPGLKDRHLANLDISNQANIIQSVPAAVATRTRCFNVPGIISTRGNYRGRRCDSITIEDEAVSRSLEDAWPQRIRFLLRCEGECDMAKPLPPSVQRRLDEDAPTTQYQPLGRPRKPDLSFPVDAEPDQCISESKRLEAAQTCRTSITTNAYLKVDPHLQIHSNPLKVSLNLANNPFPPLASGHGF